MSDDLPLLNAGRCECLACGPYRCEGEAAHLAVGTEATLSLCVRCYQGHRADALAVAEQE